MTRWVLWFVALYVLYEIVAMVQDATEAITGLFVAAIATALIELAFRLAPADVQARWRWLSHLSRVPGQMLRDAVNVLWRIVLSLTGGANLEGTFVRIPFNVPGGNQPFEQGRGALAIYGICVSPNSIVADVDPRGELLVHKLIAGEQPAESPDWPL